MITVAIVEDNETVRQTLTKWIGAEEGMYCACACSTGKEAMLHLPRIRPDVVLMDIHLPGESGIACTTRIREKLPDTQVIIVTVYRDAETIFQALKAGACGYLLKRSSREEIIRAIHEVRAGGAPMSGEIARRVIEAFRQPSPSPTSAGDVSPREREVLELLSRGMSNKQIAAELGISYETVCVHLRRVYEKLHVRSRTEAVIKFLGRQSGGNGRPGPESVSEAGAAQDLGAGELEGAVGV